ncbi:MAG: hypothetical protein WC810_25180 [Janthinobacterium sp.]
MDMLIISFYFVFNFLILPGNETVLTYLNTTSLVVVIFLIDVTVPWYLANLTASYGKPKNKYIVFMIRFAKVTAWFVCGMLGFFLPIILNIQGYIDEFALGMLIVGGLVGVIISYTGGSVDRETPKSEDYFPGFLYPIMLVLLVVVVLGSLVSMLWFFVNGMVLYGLLTIAGMVVGITLIASIFMYGLARLFRTSALKQYIQPAIVMVLVLLWQDLFYALMTSGYHSQNTALILFYGLSGVLPVRLLMMFEPPVKPLSIVIGGVVMVVYGSLL